MCRDIVITTIKDYEWSQITPFIVSLDRSGFAGEKVIFVENIPQATLDKLSDYGWVIVPTITNSTVAYTCARYEPIAKYLNEHKDAFGFVIIADIRDVIFQTDPSIWLKNNLSPHKLIGASECVRIKDQNVNSRWIKECMGDEMEEWLANEEVCCAGTIVGVQSAVAELCQKIIDLLNEVSGWGYEQAYLNYLIRVSPLEEITRIPRLHEGFIVSCSWFLCDPEIWKPFLTDKTPIFDHNNILICAPDTSVPFAIVHQYDRNWWWKASIEQKYSDVKSR